MKLLTKILLGLGIVVVAIQFIRPEKNSGDTGGDIRTVVDIPADVRTILETSCYDCHSNSTRYPWYAEVMPVGWLLSRDVMEAKKHLNFSEFAAYKAGVQRHKLEEVANEVYEDKMPLPIYLVMHDEAKLSEEQKKMLLDWADAAAEALSNREQEPGNK